MPRVFPFLVSVNATSARNQRFVEGINALPLEIPETTSCGVMARPHLQGCGAEEALQAQLFAFGLLEAFPVGDILRRFLSRS